MFKSFTKVKGLVVGGIATCSLFLGATVVSADEKSTDSIVDYLYHIGDNHSYQYRSELAKENGIEGYKGTATQNLELLSILRDNGQVDIPEKEFEKVEDKVEEQVETETKSEEIESTSTKETNSTEVSGKTLTVSATAYTANCTGCSGVTATGVDLHANPNSNVIAVDPNVIPLGSEVHVEGYGTFIANDTGGSIKGNKIDIYMQNHSDAVDFGRKQLEVTILD